MLIKRLLVVGLLVVGASAFGGVLVRLPEAEASPRPQTVAADPEQAGPNRAALVIRFSNDNVVTKCVSFSEPVIDGEELLQRSGLGVGVGDDGAICSIANAGCPTSDCFCECPFPECNYWAYYPWTSGAWQYSGTGARWTDVTNGTLQAWSWGQGDFTSGVEPPAISFEQVCQTAATPTATATATATPTATATTPPAQGQPTALPTSPAGGQALPQVTLTADSTRIAANTCTVLRWVTWDATQVTLNGAPVGGQDRLEVCLAATERYVLVAANNSGQTTREITVEVTGAAQSPATPAPPPQSGFVLPAATLLQPDMQPPIQQQAPVPTVAPQVLDQAGALPETAPTALPIIQPTPTVAFTFASPPTATPRPRRVLGADGRPTPTPILVARADPAAAVAAVTTSDLAAAAGAPPVLPTVDRSFRAALLPGYAAYLMLAASLVGACVWVIRRKGDSGPER